jgi:hypothetical protein
MKTVMECKRDFDGFYSGAHPSFGTGSPLLTNLATIGGPDRLSYVRLGPICGSCLTPIRSGLLPSSENSVSEICVNLRPSFSICENLR